MPLVINPNDRSKVVDRTDSLIQIPNTVGITNALGLFTPQYSTQKTVEVVRVKRGSTLLEDRNWDERNQTIAGRSRDSLLLKIPHFPADDAITPNDIDGIVSANSMAEAAELESVANVRADKMFDLREAHGLTLEAARMQLITDGTVYAPNGTVDINYYTEFGITREEIVTGLAASTDPRGDFDDAKAAVRAGLSAGDRSRIRRFVVLASDSYFRALKMNAYVTDAMKAVSGTQSSNALLGLLDSLPSDASFEYIDVFGILFINAGVAGYENAAGTFVPFVPEGDAYMMPAGVRDMFKTYFAPANRFGTINKRAQGSYWYEYMNDKDDIIEIMTEQNFLNALLAPGAIVRLSLV